MAATNSFTMSNTVITGGACVYCREAGGHTMNDCPACQDLTDTRKANLATRKALDDLLELHGQAVFKIDACDLEEALQAIEKCAAVLKWPSTPLPDL